MPLRTRQNVSRVGDDRLENQTTEPLPNPGRFNEPDWVVAIARGGLLIGGAVAYALSLKNIGVVNVEFYTDIDERLEVPVMLPPALNLSDLANQRLLIVDDVADTGETLQLVVDTCRPVVAEIRSMVLYEKPRSIISPDFVWKSTDDWINFPWSSEPPLR